MIFYLTLCSFVFFFFAFFYLVQKQTIVSLDTSCYRGVPLKTNLWFAVKKLLSAIEYKKSSSVKTSLHPTG